MQNLNQTVLCETMELPIYQDGEVIYPIFIRNSFDDITTELNRLQLSDKRICIVTESNVARYYLDELTNIINGHAKLVVNFVFEAGEEQKNLSTVTKLYEFLIQSELDRNDMLIALGGGVTGDLCGFTAATYLRGIRFIQVPTSLLAMVDSSIGGKTGVDLNAYKNMVGAFYQPKSVYINAKCVKTLPRREYVSGFAEIIKYGLITDRSFYDWLTMNREKLLEYDEEALNTAIYRSCLNKKLVVEEDPTEQGVRALLNLGHTIGHAIEKLMNFAMYHGECVAIGTIAACHLSFKKGLITESEYNRIKELFLQYELPIQVSGLSAEEILIMTKSDKKMAGGRIRFILIEGIGNGIIDATITDQELLQTISTILV